MLKHQKSVHNKTCNQCNKTFISTKLKEAHYVEHLSSYYTCPFCSKIVKLRRSLLRHLKKQHQPESANIDFSKIKATTKSSNCETNATTREKPEERLLHFNDLEMDLATNFEMQENIDGQEVCLLANTDQGLTLGNYIFFNRR